MGPRWASNVAKGSFETKSQATRREAARRRRRLFNDTLSTFNDFMRCIGSSAPNEAALVDIEVFCCLFAINLVFVKDDGVNRLAQDTSRAGSAEIS